MSLLEAISPTSRALLRHKPALSRTTRQEIKAAEIALALAREFPADAPHFLRVAKLRIGDAENAMPPAVK